MRALNKDHNYFKDVEPFNGLFTQGMVCHETYKDQNSKWLSPEEIETNDGKIFMLKDFLNKELQVGPSEVNVKIKKTQ